MTATPRAETGTAYHVFLEKTDREAGVKIYEPVDANVTARSADEAIRQTAKTEGVYVAVPARSFKPVTVTVKTETKITLG